jgi:urease accessory protein
MVRLAAITAAITMASRIKMSGLALSFVALLLGAAAAHAHTAIGDTQGLAHGFAHPIGGIDHVLVMVAVGLFAVHLGGRARWLVPLSFVAMMALGGALGAVGAGLPLIETGIALSVVILGIAVAARLHLPTVAAIGLVGCFALFHGQAHGAELPDAASGLAYGAGFLLASLCLQVVGIGLGLAIGKAGDAFGDRVLQAAGSAMALAGVAILAGSL